MQLRIKNFGLIKQWPRTNGGFIRLDGVTVFTSGNVDAKNLHALTTLIALFPQIEMDIEGIYHDVSIKDGSCPNVRQMLAAHDSSSTILKYLSPDTVLEWNGECYNMCIDIKKNTLVFHENESALLSSCLHFPYKDALDYRDILLSVQQAVKNGGKLLCSIDCIEQGLPPSQQEAFLFSLLEAINHRQKNHLVFSTYSPYILAALTNAAKADELLRGGFDAALISALLPITAATNNNKIALYEIDQDGTVMEVTDADDLPASGNILNETLEKSRDVLSRLLDIEMSCFLE